MSEKQEKKFPKKKPCNIAIVNVKLQTKQDEDGDCCGWREINVIRKSIGKVFLSIFIEKGGNVVLLLFLSSIVVFIYAPYMMRKDISEQQLSISFHFHWRFGKN